MSEDEPMVDEPREDELDEPEPEPTPEPKTQKKSVEYKLREWIRGVIHLSTITLDEAKKLYAGRGWTWDTRKLKGKGRLLIVNHSTKIVIQYN